MTYVFRFCWFSFLDHTTNVSLLTVDFTRNKAGVNGHQVTSDGAATPSVVRHLELDSVPDLDSLNVSLELAVVEEEASLALAALHEAVRVQQLLYDAGLPHTGHVGGRRGHAPVVHRIVG